MVYSSSLRNKKGEAFGFWRNFGGTGALSDQRMNRFDRARQALGVMVWNVGDFEAFPVGCPVCRSGDRRSRVGGDCMPIGRSAFPGDGGCWPIGRSAFPGFLV